MSSSNSNIYDNSIEIEETDFGNVKRTLTSGNIVWLTLGALVGAGLITISGEAAGITGYSIWLAYGVAVILGFLAVIPYFIAGGTAVLDGGMYTTNALFGHPVLGGLTALNSIPVVLGQASVAIGIGYYIQTIFPDISSKLISIAFVVIFFLLNLVGVDALSGVQKYMMYALIIGFTVFCIYAFRDFNLEALNVSGDNFFAGGFLGFAVAVNMLSFSTQAYYNALSYSKYTIKPKRNVLKGMLITVPLVLLVYVAVTLAAAGAVDIGTFANHTLSDVAKQIMPTGLFVAFTIFAPLMALLTTLNGNMSSMSITIQAAADDGWLPRSFGKLNKFGMSTLSLTLVTLLILVPVLLNLSIDFITNNVMLFTNAMLLVPFYSVWRLPKKFPELWEKSAAKMPMWAFHTVMVIALLARIILISFSVVSLSLTNLIINLVTLALIVLYCVVRYKQGKVSVNPKYAEE